MAALDSYHFEPERVQDENEASDDDNEESERLNNLRQDFRTGPYFIMHTAFVLKEQ